MAVVPRASKELQQPDLDLDALDLDSWIFFSLSSLPLKTSMVKVSQSPVHDGKEFHLQALCL